MIELERGPDFLSDFGTDPQRIKNPSFGLLEKKFSVAEWVRVRECLSIKCKAVMAGIIN